MIITPLPEDGRDKEGADDHEEKKKVNRPLYFKLLFRHMIKAFQIIFLTFFFHKMFIDDKETKQDEDRKEPERNKLEGPEEGNTP